MTDLPQPEFRAESSAKAPERLFGSKVADIIAGILAALLWWALAVGATSATTVGPVVVAAAFLAQMAAVGFLSRKATAFLASEVIAAILLPALALGLLFGACMFSGSGLH